MDTNLHESRQFVKSHEAVYIWYLHVSAYISCLKSWRSNITRCQKRKSQHFFFQGNTYLTMVCEPKYLYEISTPQLRCCRALDNSKVNNNYTEKGKKINFTIFTYTPPLSWQNSAPRQIIPFCNFSTRWKERVKHVSNIPELHRDTQGIDLYLSSLISADGTRKAWMPGGS